MDQRIAEMVNFEIVEQSENGISASFVVNEKLPSFEGHFPGDPILPAVSIIDISLHLLSQVVPNISHNNIEVKRSKFMAMVRPTQEVDIEAETEDGKNWRFTWKLKESQSKLAQVHLVV